MPGTKLSGRQIMQLFYTEVDRSVPVNGMDEGLDVPTIFRCKCGKTRAQKLKHGYTNLVQHVLVKHSDWVTAATQEAVPIPVPTAINSAKLATVKANGKKRVQTEGKSISQVITGNNNAISNSSDNEPKAQKTVIVKQSTSAPLQVQKRSDYLSWDDYFMSVAFLSAMRSKDPSTQVGACIVNTERKIVGIGYNGFPNRCGDDELPWARVSQTNSPLDTKYPYVCHAEMNAILNKNCADVKGCTVRVFKCTMEGFMALLTREYAQIYVALFPCNECAKLIIQSGISRVVYCSDKYKLDWKFVASRRLLDMAGVQYTHHQLQRSKIVIDFTSVV